MKSELQQQAEALFDELYPPATSGNVVVVAQNEYQRKCYRPVGVAIILKHLAPLKAQLVEWKQNAADAVRSVIEARDLLSPGTDICLRDAAESLVKENERATGEQNSLRNRLIGIVGTEKINSLGKEADEKVGDDVVPIDDLIEFAVKDLWKERDEARREIEILETRHAATMLHTQTVVDENQQLQARVAELEGALVKSKDAMFQYNSGCYPLSYPPESLWKREAMDAVTNALGDKPSNSLLRQQELERKAREYDKMRAVPSKLETKGQQ